MFKLLVIALLSYTVQDGVDCRSTEAKRAKAIAGAPPSIDFTANVQIYNPIGVVPMTAGPAATSKTPAQIRSAYQLPSSGGSGSIAIVVAYHYPSALADLNVFSKQFGLPFEASNVSTLASNTVFQQVYVGAGGTKVSTPAAVNIAWNQEAAMDIQWALAMAPNAKIILNNAIGNHC